MLPTHGFEPLGAHCTLVCFSRCVAISPMHFAGTSLASDLHQLATFWFSSGRLSTQSHAASCPVKCRYWLPTQFAAYSWVAAEGELFRLPVRWVVRKLFGRPHQSAWTVLRRTATAVRASRRSSPSYSGSYQRRAPWHRDHPSGPGVELQEVGIKSPMDHQDQCWTLDQAHDPNRGMGPGLLNRVEKWSMNSESETWIVDEPFANFSF